LGILDEVEKIVQETPPVDNAASRFGNPAFKTFYDKVEEVSVVYILGSGMISLLTRSVCSGQKDYIKNSSLPAF
jgi:hypothetical protein